MVKRNSFTAEAIDSAQQVMPLQRLPMRVPRFAACRDDFELDRDGWIVSDMGSVVAAGIGG
jgi:hypothetical protein